VSVFLAWCSEPEHDDRKKVPNQAMKDTSPYRHKRSPLCF